MARYDKNIEKNFLFILCIIFIILTFIVVKDIFSLIICSFILSYFLHPLYLKLKEKLQNKKIASLITLMSSVLLFFIPFALISYFFILSLIKLILEYKIYIENPEILNTTITNFLGNVTNSSLLASIDFSQITTYLVTFIINFSEDFFSTIPKMIIYIFVILFISYYILIHNKNILNMVNEYIPLSLKKQNALIKNIEKNIKVLFKGYFLTGLLQTIIALLGYIIFGAPNILILTFITLIASLIPYLGTPLVWAPVSLYMIIIGDNSGYGLLIYGTIIISMVDNFARPWLMSSKDTIHPALVFIGFIGGMIAFGIIGLIIGPIIISITSILLKYLKDMYVSA